MRIIPVALLATYAFTGLANATVADYTKYYYFDYEFYSGQFNISVETMYSWPNGTISFYDLDNSATLQSWPMFHFGFFLQSRDVEEVAQSPFTFSTSSGHVDAQRGMDGIYFFRPYDFDEYNDYFHAGGSLSFDHDLNIVSWDVSGSSCYACNSDSASSSPTPLGPLWDELFGSGIDWNLLTGTDFPDGGYYSSNYWEPYELMFSTAIGRWEKRTSVVCWSYTLDDEIDCPSEVSSPAPIPLPASLPLLAGALFLLAGARRLRKPAA